MGDNSMGQMTSMTSMPGADFPADVYTTKFEPHFSFLTNHAHVLLLIAGDNSLRMRDLASSIGITERAVQRIIDELATAGYLAIVKDGRRNRYIVRSEHPLVVSPVAHRSIGDLVRFASSVSEETPRWKLPD